MPRKRIKKPPKPVHLMPTLALLEADWSDPEVNKFWTEFVETKIKVDTSTPIPFDTACKAAAHLASCGITARVLPVSSPAETSAVEGQSS